MIDPVNDPMQTGRSGELSLRETDWFRDAVGTFKAGASYLIGGAPGSRKSGLVLQIGIDLARQRKRVLLIPTEESADKVRERLLQMLGEEEPDVIQQVLTHLVIERNPPTVETLPHYVSSQVLSASGNYHGSALVILDSVQGHGLVSARTRAYDRVLEATRLLSWAGVTSLLVNQLTKRNELTGPRTLEHGVDAVLMLRKTPSCRLLFTIKNRHGPANLRDPVTLILDPVSLRLRQTPLAKALHSSAHTYLGAGLGGAIEVQASVGLAMPGTPGRVVSPGLPKAELQQLISIIRQLPEIDLDDLDFAIHCRLPGAGRRYHGCGQLALAMALLSSYLRQPIPPNALFLGEIDLGRRICPIPDQLVHDLTLSLEGVDNLVGLWTIYCHPSTAHALIDRSATIIPCDHLEAVMYHLWPQLR